jgi:alkaline phosphatase D
MNHCMQTIRSAVFVLAIFAAPLSARITHGPILGHVTAREIHVWARTDRPGSFRIRYGIDPARLDQLTPAVPTALERDNAAWLQFGGLAPDTRYHYRVVQSDDEKEIGPSGTFRTLPDPAVFRDPQLNPKGLFNFRFEFGSCNNQRPGDSVGRSLPAFQTMLTQLRDNIYFSILNGDWLYEEKREFTVPEWQKQVGIGPDRTPPLVRLLPSIVGVWENYKWFLEAGPNLAAWHREIPSYFTPDDHEILNDIYGAGSTGIQNRRTVFRDIGMQAWYDYVAGSNPVPNKQPIHFGQARLTEGSDILYDESADFTRFDLKQAANLHVHWGGATAGVDSAKLDAEAGDPNAGVYEIAGVVDRNRLRIRPAARASSTPSYSIGRLSYFSFRVGNAEFYLLDTRSHRDMHDVKNPRRPGLSMIGRQQRQWLIDSMSKSDADVFFIASSVNLTIPHVGSPSSAGPIEGKDDAWTAFVDEREQLIRFWDSLKRPVLVMTGDLHNSFAIKVTDRVWEFGSGPHNSANHPARSEGGRPANGPFDSRGRRVDIRWSSYIRDDVPANLRRWPIYAVAQVNNVFPNPGAKGETRWVAYPKPQVVIQYHDGRTGNLLYAESVSSN